MYNNNDGKQPTITVTMLIEGYSDAAHIIDSQVNNDTYICDRSKQLHSSHNIDRSL